MAEFRLDSMGSLARQMRFTPHETLSAQLVSAEALLSDIDPAKAYPYDFVIFRITGYHPKGKVTDLLTGMALQHDLGLLIEQLSSVLDLKVADLAEPVLPIDQVSERFNVTSKTVQRWRKRGLAARRFVFPDGKRRVGFLLSSVERFFNAHREQIPRDANFSQVDSAEREFIVRRARVLARDGGCWEAEIARRIGRRLQRSPATILATLRKHDQENSANAVLNWAPIPIPTEESGKILRAYRHGATIASLARKYHQSRAAIYRVVMDERIARLNKRKIRFIDDPLYHQPDAELSIKQILMGDDLGAPPKSEELRVPKDLPAYLQDLYRTPLLSAAKERALFVQYNFHRFQFVQARRELEPQFATSADLDRLEGHLRNAVELKNQIIRANLRLVVSVARKHLRPGLNLMELISDGNITLMRAVEGYDIHRGHRFSTYATLALMKGFARSVPTMQAAAKRANGSEEMLSGVADARRQHATERFLHRDEIRQLLSRLDLREREVLQEHYGLGDRSEPATFEEVGQRLGLSKQRVKQIERIAIEKLRSKKTI